jgi:hypothetical protein
VLPTRMVWFGSGSGSEASPGLVPALVLLMLSKPGFPLPPLQDMADKQGANTRHTLIMIEEDDPS